ncbi:hypothetical protein CK203_021807 [Vitis vinifera]|uniref:Uncharacterized protein n=1 Tax=Vitis vinifera TaxID=29760 RepID=A0A438JFS8_VITVI|nr:hypothetical protein CK203_021807 [Vitis vinifera]
MGILAQLGPCGEANFELEFLSTREKEAERVQQVDFHYLLTDSALVEEVSREACQNGIVSNCQDAAGPSENGNDCWELYEFQEGRGEGAPNWQESSVAKFSQFLGFPIEGLEKDILSFLVKIRKRREKIHRNVLFRVEGCSQWLSNEPQVVELECEGSEQSTKRKVIKSVIRKQKVDLFCIQETKIQVMSDRVVSSLGLGRFLDWKALDAFGSVGGILICWDKRALDLLEWEEDSFPYPADSGMWIMGWFGCSRGIEVSGSANFRLSAKLKELKQKLKVWNREVFGNLECNKDVALQQVEYWIGCKVREV